MKTFLIICICCSSSAADAVTVDPVLYVSTVNTYGNKERPSSLTSDGLSIIIGSQSGPGSGQLLIATRSTIGSPFSAPTDIPFQAINNLPGDQLNAKISADGLSLYFSYASKIYTATRVTTASQFGNITLMPNVNIGSVTFPSYLSHDGLRLYLYALDSFGIPDLYMASRSSSVDDFDVPSATIFANINTPFTEVECALTDDERTIFFTTDRIGGQGGWDIWYATRPDLLTPFGQPQPLTQVNTTDNDRFVAVRGNELYFGSDRLGDYDVYVALFAVPEPIGLTQLIIGIMILMWYLSFESVGGNRSAEIRDTA